MENSEILKGLLRLVAIGGAAGAAGRVGQEFIRETNPRYTPPTPAKPIVANMPYRVSGPVMGLPEVDPEKERQIGRVKAAAPVPAAPVPPVPTVPAPSVDWVGRISPAPPPPIGTGQVPVVPPIVAPTAGSPEGGAAGKKLTAKKADSAVARFFNNLMNYENPWGPEGATRPSEAPLWWAGMPIATAAGLGLGYSASDRILRAADRRHARGELDEAKKEYQKSIVQRLAGSPAVAADKSASVSTTTYTRTKKALDAAYERVKSAANEAEEQLAARALWPGLFVGPNAAALNMMVSGSLAGLGGYAGYRLARDAKGAKKVRSAIEDIDRANATAMPSPLIARLVPVSDQNAATMSPGRTAMRGG